jgi:hypothetical protein
VFRGFLIHYGLDFETITTHEVKSVSVCLFGEGETRISKKCLSVTGFLIHSGVTSSQGFLGCDTV